VMDNYSNLARALGSGHGDCLNHEWFHSQSDLVAVVALLVAGDSVTGTLKEPSVSGDKFSVCDLLMEGPIVESQDCR
jgi:hypothetical protein